LIRHGESTWNESATVQGHADGATLTDNGREQVRDALAALRPQGIASIISSDLRRTVETAQIIADGLDLEISTTPALRERSFGVFEGRPIADLGPEVSGIHDGMVVDADARPHGGESLDEFYGRVGLFLETLRHRRGPNRILLVTHGGTIRVAHAYGARTPMLGSRWYRVSNASIWNLDLDGTAR
jgi:broad specificity phosphatase PhoE